MKLVVVGSEKMVRFFGLGGVEGMVVNQSNALSVLSNCVKNREYGLIIISEEVFVWCGDYIQEVMFNNKLPLIVSIPFGKGESGNRLEEFIRKSIGIKI